MRVQLAQVNYRYGSNVFLPYSVGMIEAYARATVPDVEFAEPLFLRDPIEEVVEAMESTDVLGLSCYIWNWQYTQALGRAVRRRFPRCLIVLGGPQVPHDSDAFIAANPWADLLVHYEGEAVFSDILVEASREQPDYSLVTGVVICATGQATPSSPRIADLDILPSPYLTGVFDRLMTRTDLDFQASQETHRGCPYSCTFCDWGSATMNKVRRFSDNRLIAEFEWMADHGIDLLYNCDANYGLFERDLDLTKALVDVKRRRGKPTKFRAAYAKNSNQRVFDIATALNAEGMCKGVTLSFQSMDPHTLDLIKRKNMAVNDFGALITSYRQASIPTYTELIIGLPGESYDSFANGIDALITAGQHDSLNVYHAMMLPNSEMSKPNYVTKHGIRSVETPLLLLHGTPSEVAETYRVVIATATMPEADWVKTSLFAYVVQAFHCLNLTQDIAVTAFGQGVSYRKFYESLIAFFAIVPSTIMYELDQTRRLLRAVQAGDGTLDFGDRTFGDVMWPVEEILFLRLLKAGISDNLAAFVESMGLPTSILDVQRASTVALDHRDWPTFAREVVWYGRKGGSMRRTPLTL